MSGLPPMLTPLSPEFLGFSLAHSPGHFHAFLFCIPLRFLFYLGPTILRFLANVAYAFCRFCLVKFHRWLPCFQSCTLCYSGFLVFWVHRVQTLYNLCQPPSVLRPPPKPCLAPGWGYLHVAAMRLTFSDSPGKTHPIFLPHLHATLEGTLAALSSVCGTIQAALHH